MVIKKLTNGIFYKKKAKQTVIIQLLKLRYL